MIIILKNIEGDAIMDENKEYDLRKRSYAFSVSIVMFVKTLTARRALRPLVDQTLRSGTSIGANIMEAKSACSTKDFMNYHQIALKSGNECVHWLSLLRDTGEATKDEVEPLLKETIELTKILAAGVLTMKRKLKKA
jgi:four helix bundle protein